MGLIRGLLTGGYGAQAGGPPAWHDYWYQPVGMASPAGVPIGQETALRISTVWACATLISEAIGSLPLITYRRLDNGGKQRATNHPLYEVLHDQPNATQTAPEFKSLLQMWALMRGNGYARIRPGPRGPADHLDSLSPDLCWPELTADGTLRYRVRDAVRGTQEAVNAEDVFHLRGPSVDGYSGLSTVAYARTSMGLSLAAEEYGARFFGQGATPSGVLSTDQKLRDDAVVRRVQEQWQQIYGGLSNSHKVAVLDGGLKYQAVAMPMEDAQFLECVTLGTMIAMADGSLRRAEELAVGDLVLGWDGATDSLVPSRIAHVGDNGAHPIYRVVTDRGRVLETTGNHPYLASRRQRCEKCGRRHESPEGLRPEWIEVRELRVGDYLRVGLGYEVDGPLGEQDAYLLGALIGDGHLRTRGSVGFSSVDRGVIERVKDAAAAIGSELRYASRCDYYLAGNGYGSKNRPRAFLREHGIADLSARTKIVPPTVFAGGVRAWRGFMAGLIDTDGTVTREDAPQPKVVINSVSRDLLAGCQHLLALLDVQSSLGESHAKYRGQPWVGYNLTVTGRTQVAKLAGVVDLAHIEKRRRLAAWGESMPAGGYHPDQFKFDRIKSIEVLPAQPTLSIEVADTHSHVTNGLITHNTRAFEVEDIARWFRVPLPLIGHMEKQTSWGSGIEMLGIQFLTYCILPWLRRWEAAVRGKLILAPQLYFVEFLVDALLRGDIKSRYDAYGIGRQWGWLSGNDIRRLENQDPVDGLDTYLQPLNMAPVGGGQQALPPGQAAAENPHLRFFVHDAAGRVLRRESAALGRIAKRCQGDAEAWAAGVGEFYAEHAEMVRQTMRLSIKAAGHWAAEQREALVERGPELLTDDWEIARAEDLAALALAQGG